MPELVRPPILQTLKELDDLLARHQVRYGVLVHDLYLALAQTTTLDVPHTIVMQARQLFGGMGSLTDLYISRANGHAVDDERAANQELHRLSEALWEMVSAE